MHAMALVAERIRRTLRREDGVALVVVAGVIMMIGILTAVVATAAVNVRERTTEDRAAKRALAAAEAGVQRALYELNRRTPTATQCVSVDPGGASVPAPGDIIQGSLPTVEPPNVHTHFCKGHGYLGNGAAYDYYMTPVLNPAVDGLGLEDCYGINQLIQANNSQITLDQRCVVAVGCVEPTVTDPQRECVDDVNGTVRGTYRRVQVRTGAQEVIQFFPAGLFGNQKMCIGTSWNYSTTDCGNTQGCGNARVDSDIGTNEKLVLCQKVPVCNKQEGPTVPGALLLGDELPAEVVKPGENDCPNANINGNDPQEPKQQFVPPFEIPGVERGFRGCLPKPAPCDDTVAAVSDTALPLRNDAVRDATLPSKLEASLISAGFCSGPPNICDPATSCAMWDPDNRELDLRECPAGGGSATLTLTSGNYNLCRFWTGGKVNLALDAGVGLPEMPSDPSETIDPFAGPLPVRFLIDSPYRPGSGCGKGSPLADDTPIKDSTPATSPTLGSVGTSWDEPSGGNPSENCPSQGPKADDYRCADGSLYYENNAAINTGGGGTNALRLQFWIYGNPPQNEFPTGTTCPPNNQNYDATTDTGQLNIPLSGGSSYSLPCGNNPPLNTVDFRNGSNATVTLYAPWSTIIFGNPQQSPSSLPTIGGGIRARNLVVGNNLNFQQDPLTRDVTEVLELRRYHRGPWVECRRGFTATDPRTGC